MFSWFSLIYLLFTLSFHFSEYTYIYTFFYFFIFLYIFLYILYTLLSATFNTVNLPFRSRVAEPHKSTNDYSDPLQKIHEKLPQTLRFNLT